MVAAAKHPDLLMKVNRQAGDLFLQIQEILDDASVSSADIVARARTVELEAPEQPAIVATVVDAITGKIESSEDLRDAIGEQMISSQLNRMGVDSASPTCELTRTLLSNDPVFARLVDQTILATTRLLAGQ